MAPEYCGAKEPEDTAPVGDLSASEAAAEALANKRKRLLRKMEISMQAWTQQQQEEQHGSGSAALDTGSSAAPGTEPDPDDSGPYERIAGDLSSDEEEGRKGAAAATEGTLSQRRKFGELGRMQFLCN